MNSKINLLFFLLTFTTIASYAQKAFLGGGSSPMMPVVNYLDYSNQGKIMGNHYGQCQEVISSSDGSLIYFQTQDAQTLKNRIYKFDAENETYISEFNAKSYSRNLQISDDNAYLFFNTSFMLYKADAISMTLIDSMVLTTHVANISVYDNNIVYCNSLYKTFKADFTSHSFVDSVLFEGNGRMTFNESKTKLFAIRETPSEVGVLNLSPFLIDTAIVLQNNTGKPEDVLCSNGNLFVKSYGFSGNNGTLKVIDTVNYVDVMDHLIPEGTGYLNTSPNGKLWIPCSYSKNIVVLDLTTNSIDSTLSVANYNNLASCYTIAFSESTITDVQLLKEENLFTVYPNPTTGIINLSENTFDRIIIFNTAGQVVYSSNKPSNRIELNQPKGIYIIEIRVDNTNTLWKRIVLN